MQSWQLRFLNITLWWHYFLSFFGLSAAKEIGRDSNNVRYGTSPVKVVYSLFVLSLVFTAFSFQLKYVQSVTSSSLGLSVLNVFMIYGTSFLTAFLVISSQLQNKNYATLVTKIIQCEFSLPLTGSDKYSDVITRQSILLAVFWSIVLIGSILYDVLTRMGKGLSLELLLNMGSGYLFLLYNVFTVAHFATMQLWLQKSFLRINLELIRYSTLRNEKGGFFRETKKSVAILEDIFNNVTPTKVEQRILHNISNSKYLFIKENNAVQKIKKLRKLYNDVFKISRKIDAIFSFKCLIVAFANLSFGTLVLFYTLRYVSIYMQNPSDYLLHNIISFLKNFCVCLIAIWGMIWPCGNACKEAKNTALILQDSLANAQHDELLINELKDFALQVQQEKVYFSPYGLFYLENKLIVSVLATMTSYLVILMQFFPFR